MHRPGCSKLLLLALLCVLMRAALAQDSGAITLRILDSKTGTRITPTGFLVRINHESTERNNLVRSNDDGTSELHLPAGTSVFMIHVTYQASTEIYVNCDTVGQYQSVGPRWYSVDEVQRTGFVALNGCVKPNNEAKIKATAKPGEMALYVRKLTMREQMREDQF